jgi:putative ABC transport system permease protein
MYKANKEGSIYTGLQGHLTIFRKGLFEKERESSAKLLLDSHEIELIQEICKNMKEVVIVTPQLRISGLITDGKISTIFVAHGFVPSIQTIYTGKTSLKLMEPFDGNPMEDDHPEGIGVSRGLARFLNLKVSSEAVVMATTSEGQMNALDVKIFHLFDAPSVAMNDRLIRIPFSYAQQLYDTEGAHMMSVLLEKTEDTERIRHELNHEFMRKGMDLEIKAWNELSEWYTKVKDMFDLIFLFLFIIVFIIVTMSVINTLGMTVLERIREIGTLRALGLKRRGVLMLFSIESCLLGIGGIITGAILSVLGWGCVQVFKPTWIPPGVSVRVPLQIEFSWNFFLISGVFLIILCLIASLIPARRAAYLNVVEALGHV